jgi:hypothetical protein
MSEGRHELNDQEAEQIRAALIQAALDGYEQAAMSGLCGEGAWEAAVSAMRQLDLPAALAGAAAVRRSAAG